MKESIINCNLSKKIENVFLYLIDNKSKSKSILVDFIVMSNLKKNIEYLFIYIVETNDGKIKIENNILSYNLPKKTELAFLSISELFKQSYKPRNLLQLKIIVGNLIIERGVFADLNDIDVTFVKNMSYLFKLHKTFKGDISTWNVSNLKNARGMFSHSEFNGDVSSWNVSNLRNARGMFYGSKFNQQNIENWSLSPSANKRAMFTHSDLERNNNLPSWY